MARKVYQMKRKPRGFCFINNNSDFKNVNDKRIGSDLDVQKLKDTFKELLFTPIIRSDLSRNELLSELKSLAQKDELKDHDAIVISLNSHGYSEHYLCGDNRSVTFDEVLDIFSNDKCEHLKNKPKIILFNRCRDSDKPQNRSTHCNTHRNDMRVCYSTGDGKPSWISEKRGTFFVIALTSILKKFAIGNNEEIKKIFRKVNYELLQLVKVNLKTHQHIDQQYFKWRRDLYFNVHL